MKKYIPFLFLMFAFVVGYLSNDLFLGGSILFAGLCSAYYLGEGKRINYIFGFFTYTLSIYVAYLNGLYGIALFYLLLCTPMQVIGFIKWKEHISNSIVERRKFTKKTAIIVSSLAIIMSLLIGYILSLIPNQNLAFLDAFFNCLNICGITLTALRYREGILMWILNNLIGIIIWSSQLAKDGQSSLIMLISVICYLFINIMSILKWNKSIKKETRN